MDTPYPLGRIYAPDARDQRYPMARALAPPTAPLSAFRLWPSGVVLDQGDTPECTAFAWKAWLLASPIRQGAGLLCFYQQEQAIDGILLPHEGSTVRAGAQVLQRQKYITTYLWAQTLDDVRRWILLHGPVVLGTNWYESMFSLTLNGCAHIAPGARIAGGHAYVCIGYSELRQAYCCMNSWGSAWGLRGQFWMHASDLGRLLREDGEACTAVEHLRG